MTCEACRTIPPIISTGYTPHGRFETLADLNTYVTGDENARVGILDIYDVFGMANQTQRGADLLAVRLNAVVLVPDFFKGSPLKPEDMLTANDTPAEKLAKEEFSKKFLAERGNHLRNLVVIKEAMQQYQERFTSVAKWGIFGLCWGGKVTALASGPGTPFAVSGQVHPGRMNGAEDAIKISIPHIVLASKDEPAEEVAKYTAILAQHGKGGHVETYDTMWHGWMGARADLERDDARAEYIRGYNQLADFFEKHLS